MAGEESPDKQEILRFRVMNPGEDPTYEELKLLPEAAGWRMQTGNSINSLDRQLFQIRWEVSSGKEQNEFSAWRESNVILLEGVFKGKEQSRTYRLDHHPWFQYPEISLKSFLLTEQTHQRFWIISIYDLNIYKFEAIKQGVEQIKLGDELIDCIKVRIQPTGFYSIFWHATYWFRETDKNYLRYEAIHGPPGKVPVIKERLLPGT